MDAMDEDDAPPSPRGTKRPHDDIDIVKPIKKLDKKVLSPLNALTREGG